MKHIAAFSFAFLISATFASSEPLLGTWKTHPLENGSFGHVNLAPCGGGICGTLVRSFDPKGKEVQTDLLGRLIVSDMKPDGANTYSGGKIWNPDENKTYASKLVIKNNTLTVKGCILVACRLVGVWTRVSR